jgi:hypothetical protein
MFRNPMPMMIGDLVRMTMTMTMMLMWVSFLAVLGRCRSNLDISSSISAVLPLTTVQ